MVPTWSWCRWEGYCPQGEVTQLVHVYFLYRFVLCKFVICKLIWIRCIKPTMYLSLYHYFWKIGNAKLLQIIFQIPRINFGIRGEDNNVFSIVLISIYFILISIDFFLNIKSIGLGVTIWTIYNAHYIWMLA